MKVIAPLSQDKKLTIVLRVESGCLGPEGSNHVENFCRTALTTIEQINSDFLIWEVLPRLDKYLPEIQYKAAQKTLTHDQARKYLALFDTKIDEFEEHINEKLTILIEQYMEDL